MYIKKYKWKGDLSNMHVAKYMRHHKLILQKFLVQLSVELHDKELWHNRLNSSKLYFHIFH